MDSLIKEMEDCKTVEECIEVATMDTYGEEEQASGWLACIEEMFGKFKTALVLGEEVILKKFDLSNASAIIAICLKGKISAKIALESLDFPNLSDKQKLWLNAWKEWSHG